MTKRIFTNLGSILESLLMAILYPVVAAGIVIYFVHYMGSLITHEPAQSPLELAGVAAALGGFILLSAFFKEGVPLEAELRRIAKLFLGVVVSLTVLFFVFEMATTMKSPTLGLGEWSVIIAA